MFIFQYPLPVLSVTIPILYWERHFPYWIQSDDMANQDWKKTGKAAHRFIPTMVT